MKTHRKNYNKNLKGFKDKNNNEKNFLLQRKTIWAVKF